MIFWLYGCACKFDLNSFVSVDLQLKIKFKTILSVSDSLKYKKFWNSAASWFEFRRLPGLTAISDLDIGNTTEKNSREENYDED